MAMSETVDHSPLPQPEQQVSANTEELIQYWEQTLADINKARQVAWGNLERLYAIRVTDGRD